MKPNQDLYRDFINFAWKNKLFNGGNSFYNGKVKVKLISQLVNKMCSHCLFPVVDKSGTSYYHLVTRLMTVTNLQQVVPTSLISSARKKLLTT